MIAWIIPNEEWSLTTGLFSTTYSSSSSGTASENSVVNPIAIFNITLAASTSESGTQSRSSSSKYIVSFDQTGITSYSEAETANAGGFTYSSSSSFSSTERPFPFTTTTTSTYSEGTFDSGTNSNSSFFSGETTESRGFTFNVVTTTNTTFTQNFLATFSTQSFQDSAITTSQQTFNTTTTLTNGQTTNSTITQPTFITTTTNGISYFSHTKNQTIEEVVTTIKNETQSAVAYANVFQAKTKYASDAEIIYHIDSPAEDGTLNSYAADFAETKTIFTGRTKQTTSNIEVGSFIVPTPSITISNQSLSGSISWINAAGFTNSNSFLVWPSNTFTLNNFITTRTVIRWGRSRDKITKANLTRTYEETITTPTKTTLSLTAPRFTTATLSSTNNITGSFTEIDGLVSRTIEARNDLFTQASSHAEGMTTYNFPAHVDVVAINSPPARLKSGIITYTAPIPTTTTLQQSTSILTTTSSIAGTRTIAAGSPIRHFGGGAFPPSITVIENANRGVYGNRVDGGTISADGNATFQNNQVPVSVFEGVRNLTPPNFSSNQGFILWLEKRNSTGIPVNGRWETINL